MITSSIQRQRRARRLLVVLVALLPLALLTGLASGAVNLPPMQALRGLLAGADGGQAAMIVQQIRLPRVLLAAVMGAVLAMSGAAMQGLFRNPLADPSLIGVTAGASLGASLLIVLGGGMLQGFVGLTLV
ncbi:MAG: iron chelate uptake ABC transporter family permease subunit, partial [Haliea sp.]